MATTERDYYELLGVPRDADDSQIKKAFRRLARELHPDVNDAADADDQFRAVAEAYEVLSNAETRALYDRYGHAGLRSGGYTPSHVDFGSLSDLFSAFFGDDIFGVSGRPGRARGADIAAEVEITLQEAARGTTREVPFQIATTCATCGGSGAEPGKPPETCPTCRGAGRLQEVSRSVFGEFIRTQTCPRCGGHGRVVTHPCGDCNGSGRTLEERRLDVVIPPGIHDGQRIRLTGEGHAGALGARAGDVYVRVTVRVPTLDGDAELEFAPGTQPGETRVLRGKGLPVLQGFGRGDQRIIVNVAVPNRLTPRQRELLDEFERLSTDDTYRPDEGFFEKLKSAFR